MSMRRKVSIVTPIHNRREISLQCLRSLSRINSTGLDIRIFVVDDGSSDGSSEAIASEFPDVEIIQGDGSLWYTEGTNVGIRAALEDNPDYVLAINDDSVFEPFFLRHLVQTADANPRSVIGPLLLLWDQPHRLFQTAPVWSTLAGGWRHWQDQSVWTVPDVAWRVDLIVGNCVLFPAEVFHEFGFMDSRRFPNFGDAEFTPRLKRSGYELVIEPRARVFCQPNAIPQRLRDRPKWQLFRELFLDLKNPANLTRTFLAHLRGGPSRSQGMVAFLILLMRIGIRLVTRNDESRNRPEPPLSEVFRNHVLAGER